MTSALDPHRYLVLIRDARDGAPFDDATARVVAFWFDDRYAWLEHTSGEPRRRKYRPQRVRVLQKPRSLMPEGRCARVTYRAKNGDMAAVVAAQVLRFDAVDDSGAWIRVFHASGDGMRTIREADVRRIVVDGADDAEGRPILDYWRRIAGRQPEGPTSLVGHYEAMRIVDRESALAHFLHRRPIGRTEVERAVLYPFGINLSQRAAVRNALEHDVSVIQGPPGTGKTQTILNIIANIVLDPGATVGVVSLNNEAVKNVGEKLHDAGYDFVVAGLGPKAKREAFFTAVPDLRTARTVHRLEHSARTDDDGAATDTKLKNLDKRLVKLQELDRERAQKSGERAAYELEQSHFREHLDRHEIPPLDDFPLLWRSSRRILALLVDNALGPLTTTRAQRIRRWLRQYLRYGIIRSLDPEDTEVVLRLQEAYYERRIAELRRRVEQIDRRLESAKYKDLRGRLVGMSQALFGAEIAARELPESTALPSYPRLTRELLQEFPVVLSTCHSLRAGLPDGELLDYLIVDEASQVDLVTAAVAMALARRIVVVGDSRQLQHIAKKAYAEGLRAPSSDTDYLRHNLLSAVIARYGDDLPEVTLQEHYRCDPMIIGYCNKKFYRDELIPFTQDNPRVARPMRVELTAPGGHMRSVKGKGAYSQRELDQMSQEVLPGWLAHRRPEDCALVSPFRLHADEAATNLRPYIAADTVHKFQGRERAAVSFTTVIDDTKQGNLRVQFVDQPHLVNVAVSRAKEEFVLVTHHSMLPRTRHIHDLIGYIRYQDPGNIRESDLVGVFDLLYRDFSQRLRPLAKRVVPRGESPAEAIAWTVLDDVLGAEEYSNLGLSAQMFVRNLVPEPSVLTPRQKEYVDNGASVDFLVHNRVTNRPVLAIEVDGWQFHRGDSRQTTRDRRKDAIFGRIGIPLLRLETTGHGEEQRIREALDKALGEQWEELA
ncbi:AAA domain-containing protein [Myceligenerans xiligouense]|uniref:Uncharacterized protein DUF2726 n=1 Tax=Myceligenerans xiligouense TaxID=253184 RepID=A0A3N4YLJ3_9MICO|nr:AAA domain-containing protein [Myceligenerans xiligouense]RPF20987.1 uncharacterized protein DUF2726 [Myceligenerans xiligouense]